MTIGFGSGGADSRVPVVIGEGTIPLPLGYTGKEAIDTAWRGAGHEGTISTSLIGKVRKDLGLTGKGTAGMSRSTTAS